MNQEVHYLTPDGEKKLKNELKELKGPMREALAKRLRAAIQQGDLSENADYIHAKEEQGFLEGRIQELERILKNCEIIPDAKGVRRETVEIGVHVGIQEGNSPMEIYHLVGPAEADPRNGKISFESPIGSALMGHRVGDDVKVITPGGEMMLKIMTIE
ncbi:MAG: transcription elongation factor GreA [Anaerolineaceae bacterium]|nr:transcription elongation factor GreA [Anaerolineaceae bacterium]MBN2678199.1 transcription elongation factor GreA [Anaerolineaceae bacterium]